MQTPHNQLFTSSQQEFLNSFISSFLINGPRSKFSEYLQFICSEIQFLAILIWMHTTFLGLGDHTNEFSFLHIISQSIATITQNNVENSLISILSKILWLYFLFALILIGNVTFRAFKLQKLSPQFQTIFSSAFQFHSGFLFWVFNMIFMTEISNMSLHSQNQAVLSINLVLLILNYGFGLLGALFCFDPFCSSNLFASRRSIFQTVSFLFKAFLAPLAVFTDSTNTDVQVFFVVFALFVSIMRVFGLFTYFAFYYFKPMKLALILTAITLWISIVNVISIIIQKSNGTTALNSSFYLILVPLPFVVKVVLAKLQNIINYYITMDPKKFQTKPQVYKKLFAYRYMSENITLSLNENKLPSNYELYFIGKLRDHAETCGDSQCLCHNFLNTKDPGINSTKNLLSKYYSLAASSLLSEAVNKFRKNTDLKIALADLIFTRAAQDLTAALVYMFSTPQENVGFFMKIKKHILKGKIQERLVEYFTGNGHSKLNIVQFIDYQAESENFLSKMSKVINKYLEFWESYQKPKLKMSEVMSKSIAIEKAADEVDGLWNSCVEKYEAFYHQMKNQYKLYLSLVRNMPHAGNQIIRKFKWKKKLREPDFTSSQLSQDDLNSSKILTVHISMARERLGRVTNVSENIQGPTGYTSRDLIGKNISFLMPSCIAEKHEELLLRRLDMLKGTSQIEDSIAQEIYIKTKAGHIIQCSAYATLFPYIQHELIYIVIIKVIASKFDHILVDSLGYIDGYTENIGKKLDLTLENRTHIKEICPDIYQEYSDIQIFNTKEENKLLETTPNLVSLEFIQRGSPANQYKYMSTLTKKTIFNKSVYIFQLESSYESKQERTSKNYVEKSSQREDSAIDIPLERILSTDIPLIPDLKSPRFNTEMKFDNLHKTGFVFKTLDTQGDVIPLTRITTIHSPTFSHSNEKNNTKRDFNADVTASNRAFLENKVSNPLPMLGKKLERIFSEGGRSTASAAETVSNKLEKAIYSLPRDKSISLFKVSAWALIVLAIGLLVILLVNTKTNLKYVKQNTSVITTSTLRLFQITELNRRARAISLYGCGLIDDQRYVNQGYRYPLLPLFSRYIGMIEPELNKYNNLVREAIEQIDATLQKELFTNLIPIIEPDLNTVSGYRNVFEATTRLVVEAQALAEVPFYELQNGTSQVNYILNNTLNDQIIVGEQIINVLISDNEIKLKTVKNLSIYFIIITSLLGFIANAFFTSNQVKFIKNRNRFIEIFLRLDQHEIEQNMNNVKAFKHSLSTNGIELEEPYSNQHGKDPKANRSFAKSYNVRTRTANMKGIDCRLLIAQILGFCIFILIVAPFVSIDILLKSETSIITNGVNNLVLVNQNLFETTLLGAAIGEYVQYNGTTTMRNRPIGDEYEATLARLSASQTVFIDLLNSNIKNKTERDQLDYLLTGNLCVGLGIQATSCSVVAKFLDKGIIGMNSFMLLTLKRMKDMFDMSDKSFTSAKNTLDFIDFIYMEYLYAISQLPVYQTLGGLLEDDIDQHINSATDAVLKIIIVSVVVGVVLGYLCSSWLWKIVKTEKVNWKKLGRKIPFSMAVSDKAFKNYLVRESDHLLNSVKDRF